MAVAAVVFLASRLSVRPFRVMLVVPQRVGHIDDRSKVGSIDFGVVARVCVVP
jgi:hypothetical protein